MLSVACYKDIKLRPCSHVLDSSCSSTKTLPDRASIPDFHNRAKLCCATPPHANFECVACYIGYVLCHILVHCEQVFEPYGQGKWMSGSRDWNPPEVEENIQERGLEFSVPNPLSQLLQHDVPRPLLFIPCWIAFHVNTRSYLVYHIMINISVYLKKTQGNLMIKWETLPLNSIGFFLCDKRRIWLFIKSANGIILPTSLNIQMRKLRK